MGIVHLENNIINFGNDCNFQGISWPSSIWRITINFSNVCSSHIRLSIDAWRILIRGIAQLLHIVPVHACSKYSEVRIAQTGHDIQDCHGPTNGSDRSFHSWVKGSIGDVLIPYARAPVPERYKPMIRLDILVRKSQENWTDWKEEDSKSSPFDLPAYKWCLVIAYDGTHFSGWQYQSSTLAIQCYLEGVLTQITKLQRENLHLVGAGRTDAEVHAGGQLAHFIMPFNYDNLDTVHKALNGLLPSDIRVRQISSAVPKFHAHFSVTSKIYHYKIYSDGSISEALCLR
ncbi:hypothetical protein ACH5RR_033402 [Cinchona calisaya]|uniref:tRNA pseudouridine synthase n=1 Tax=Cinchona calisaya TaxID=153742 RepID=A0ABD2YPF1_9GENT